MNSGTAPRFGIGMIRGDEDSVLCPVRLDTPLQLNICLMQSIGTEVFLADLTIHGDADSKSNEASGVFSPCVKQNTHLSIRLPVANMACILTLLG